jgi:nitrite reductase/ring-hydroxylating ferredoxin subunit/uncharacterized membrane protein
MSALAEVGHAAVKAIERQHWMGPAEEALQRGVARTLEAAGRSVRNLLHGTWLGHPLHPVLTDVPVGAWTVAVCFDCLDAASTRPRYALAADRSILIGVIGAVAAAAAGLADWRHTTGGARRTGFAHATLNTAALGLFVGSLVLRRRRAVGAARALSATGFLTMLASAYLGGTLVYRQRIGVDHSPEVPERVHEVWLDADLREGERRRIDVDGVSVVLFRDGGRVYAVAEQCAHLGGPLSEGRVENGTVVCPWHGSRFALADGRVIDGPATSAQPCFAVREAAGRLGVRRAA